MSTAEFGYDAGGNTTSRDTTADSVPGHMPVTGQGLSWDPEGRLAQSVSGGDTTNFAYTPDGDRFLRRDGESTTLYIHDAEVTLTRATGARATVRYVSFGGQTVALRTGPNMEHVKTLWPLLNNTATWQVDAGTGVLVRRRTLPYGESRGPSAGFIGSHGFVDGLNDPDLGLVRVGARDYDPAQGRFLTPDPLIDPKAPTQWNAYGYGNGNPVSFPDPDGLMPVQMSADGSGRGQLQKTQKTGKKTQKTGKSAKSIFRGFIRQPIPSFLVGQASSGVNGLWGIAMSAANPVYLPMSIIRPQPQLGNFISNSYKAMGGRAGGSYKAGRVTGTVGSALVPLGGWASAGSRAAASGAAKTGAMTVRPSGKTTSGGRYLFDNWHPGTFENRTRSVNYQLKTHGKGRTASQYTRNAMDFYSANKSLGKPVTLRDGSAGVKIQTKQTKADGGTQRVGGYWTAESRLVTFWD